MKNDPLSLYLSKSLSGYALATALLNDYCRVVAKLEGTLPEKVKERIQKEQKIIFDDVKHQITNSDSQHSE